MAQCKKCISAAERYLLCSSNAKQNKTQHSSLKHGQLSWVSLNAEFWVSAPLHVRYVCIANTPVRKMLYTLLIRDGGKVKGKQASETERKAPATVSPCSWSHSCCYNWKHLVLTIYPNGLRPAQFSSLWKCGRDRIQHVGHPAGSARRWERRDAPPGSPGQWRGLRPLPSHSRLAHERHIWKEPRAMPSPWSAR